MPFLISKRPSALMSPPFLHETLTDSQVSGLFLIPMLGAMTWYYLL
jgi:hypothetical protein